MYYNARRFQHPQHLDCDSFGDPFKKRTGDRNRELPSANEPAESVYTKKARKCRCVLSEKMLTCVGKSAPQ
jgi:hypothetical protein